MPTQYQSGGGIHATGAHLIIALEPQPGVDPHPDDVRCTSALPRSADECSGESQRLRWATSRRVCVRSTRSADPLTTHDLKPDMHVAARRVRIGADLLVSLLNEAFEFSLWQAFILFR